MDILWFKQQQKRVGVTADEIAQKMGRARSNVSHILNGHQRMSLDWAKAFSEVLQVPLATVLEKAGVTDAPTVQAVTPGFAESDAAPWVPGPETSGAREVSTVASALGGGRPGVDVWRVKGQAMALSGLLAGDFMLVDTHQAERVKPGDVVVAQVYNPRGATTVLRRYEPPVLIAATADPAEGRVHVVDGINVVIRGKVVASWRV
jgi:SOS-response transcriptional repressor LexA